MNHKKLYISDLDGTLLDNDARLSDFTAEAINKLIMQGMNFTFATARSVYSAKPITSKLNISVPCILMNGVSICDLKSERYIKNEFIPQNVSEKIIAGFERHKINCFMYKIHRDILTAYYTEITTEVMQSFAEERKNKFGKPFVQCEKFEADPDIVYFTATGEYEKLLPLKNEISQINGAECAFYKDTYTDKWYLEVFSDKASKANGLKFLREEYNFQYITCFGDNYNDLPMFEASDFRIAVGNAHRIVIESADLTVGENICGGVAEWLLENYSAEIKNERI